MIFRQPFDILEYGVFYGQRIQFQRSWRNPHGGRKKSQKRTVFQKRSSGFCKRQRYRVFENPRVQGSFRLPRPRRGGQKQRIYLRAHRRKAFSLSQRHHKGQSFQVADGRNGKNVHKNQARGRVRVLFVPAFRKRRIQKYVACGKARRSAVFATLHGGKRPRGVWQRASSCGFGRVLRRNRERLP